MKDPNLFYNFTIDSFIICHCKFIIYYSTLVLLLFVIVLFVSYVIISEPIMPQDRSLGVDASSFIGLIFSLTISSWLLRYT